VTTPPLDSALRTSVVCVLGAVSYYRRRGGESKHSSSRSHSARTGLRMLRLIAEKRLNLS
jgi:hypothetical protein